MKEAAQLRATSQLMRYTGAYFKAVETLLNVVVSVVPRDCTAARITIEMPPAIRAYSMAVAPDGSFQNWLRHRNIFAPSWLTSRHPTPLSYFRAVDTLVKVVFKPVPVACTAAMIATEMPAAIRPYSIAVAPDWSFQNLVRCFDIISLPFCGHPRGLPLKVNGDTLRFSKSVLCKSDYCVLFRAIHPGGLATSENEYGKKL